MYFHENLNKMSKNILYGTKSNPRENHASPRQAPLATHGHTLSPSNKSARIITSINTYKVGRGMISELNSMDQCGYWAT